jgi:hypothetical protein
MYLENLNMFKMRQYSQFKFKSNFEKRLVAWLCSKGNSNGNSKNFQSEDFRTWT